MGAGGVQWAQGFSPQIGQFERVFNVILRVSPQSAS